MSRAERVQAAYLYVIRMDRAQTVKVGRSAKPQQRLRELQTGNPDKLEIEAQVCVPAAEAGRLESAAKLALKPLRVQGEVFTASPSLAAYIIQWLASGNAVDEFIRLAVECEVAGRTFFKIQERGRRWHRAEIEAAEERWTGLCSRVRQIGGSRFAAMYPWDAIEL